jgi:hypothetical protein
MRPSRYTHACGCCGAGLPAACGQPRHAPDLLMRAAQPRHAACAAASALRCATAARGHLVRSGLRSHCFAARLAAMDAAVEAAEELHRQAAQLNKDGRFEGACCRPRGGRGVAEMRAAQRRRCFTRATRLHCLLQTQRRRQTTPLAWLGCRLLRRQPRCFALCGLLLRSALAPWVLLWAPPAPTEPACRSIGSMI